MLKNSIEIYKNNQNYIDISYKLSKIDNKQIAGRQKDNSYISKHYEKYVKKLHEKLLHYKLIDHYICFAFYGLNKHSGTSTIVQNLAMIKSQAGFKTLIVEPQNNKKIHSTQKYYLYHENKYFYRLFIGDSVPQMIKLLQDKHIQIQIKHIKSQFDFILIDTSGMDDGVLEILIKLLADAVILISQFEVTRLKEAKEKVDLLKRLNVPIIGVIINQKKSYIPKFLGKMLGYENSDDC